MHRKKLSESNTDMCVLRMDVQIKCTTAECGSGMEQRSNYAAKKDAKIMLRLEECAEGTGQNPNDVAKMDV